MTFSKSNVASRTLDNGGPGRLCTAGTQLGRDSGTWSVLCGDTLSFSCITSLLVALR